MASGLVLTYTTSGIFNFAHGAVAFATAYLYYQLNTGLGVPIVPALIISRLHLRPAARACCSTGSCCGASRRHRCTPASSAPSVSSSRCPASSSGSSSRSATTRSASTSRATRASPRAPRCRASARPPRQLRRSAASCSNTDQIAVFVVAVDRRDRAVARDPPQPGRPRDARGGRPRAARQPARRERGAHLRGRPG